MRPALYNLNIYRGDTGRWRFSFWDARHTQAADLTGVTPTAMIRDKAIGGVFQLSLACTLTLPNTVDVELTPDQSNMIPAVGVWDLQLTYSGGDIHTPVKGAAIVTQDVTRISVVVPMARAR